MKTIVETLVLEHQPYRIKKFVNHRAKGYGHFHEEVEILYFVSGEGAVTCNLKEYAVREGDIVFINGKEIHTGTLRGGCTYYCIHLSTAFFHNMLGGECVMFDTVVRDEACAALLDDLLEAKGGGFASELFVRGRLLALLERLAECHVAATLSPEEYRKKFHRLETFNEVLSYLDRHYEEEIRVEELADRFYMSPSYFSHVFKKRAGKSVIEYLNTLRIARAALLLEEESLSVAEIGRRVGFRDHNYFSRKFREVKGVTPLAWRAGKQEK